MPLLNLSLSEFLLILGGLSAAVTALYLFDRGRRRYAVPSLRFFRRVERRPAARRKRHINQPWSLLLQLAALCLLVLAIAELQFGGRGNGVHHHVLILDTSAWMNSLRPGSSRTLMEEARDDAERWLASIPSNDRVLVIRADAVPTPVTAFETRHASVSRAIAETRAGASPLDIDHALRFAEQARDAAGPSRGEIVFIGAARTSDEELPAGALPARLRFIQVRGSDEHCGLRRISAHRSPADASAWNIVVSVKNYGRRSHAAGLALSLSGVPLVARELTMTPGGEQTSGFTVRTRSAGLLEARLLADAAFTADSYAAIRLPAAGQLAISVYSDRPELLRPLLAGIPGISAGFHSAAAWKPDDRAPIVVLDRFAPGRQPVSDSIWINPPENSSPVRVRTTTDNARLVRWGSDRVLSAGLEARNVELGPAMTFGSTDDDIRVAETDAGPVVLARPGTPKIAVVGFDPLSSRLRYQLVTPLLFANLVRWMVPDAFRDVELAARSVGAVSLELDEDAPLDALSVSADGGAIPWTMDGRTIRFFTQRPGTVRVNAGEREYIYALTLATPGDVVWSPHGVRTGLPSRVPLPEPPRELWQWLALAGGLLLLAEWLIYGRRGARFSVPLWASAHSSAERVEARSGTLHHPPHERRAS